MPPVAAHAADVPKLTGVFQLDHATGRQRDQRTADGGDGLTGFPGRIGQRQAGIGEDLQQAQGAVQRLNGVLLGLVVEGLRAAPGVLRLRSCGVKRVLKMTEGEVFLLPPTGAGGWGAAIVNTLSPGDTEPAARFGVVSHRRIDPWRRRSSIAGRLRPWPWRRSGGTSGSGGQPPHPRDIWPSMKGVCRGDSGGWRCPGNMGAGGAACACDAGDDLGFHQ